MFTKYEGYYGNSVLRVMAVKQHKSFIQYEKEKESDQNLNKKLGFKGHHSWLKPKNKKLARGV